MAITLKYLSKLFQSISKRFANQEALGEPDLAQIAEHAETLDHDVPDTLQQITELRERLEYLVEEVGQENKYRTELSEYVADLRAEAKFIKTARKVFGTITTVVALALLITPGFLSYSTGTLFGELPAYPKAVLLGAMIAGGVLLLLAVTRSVYRSAHERHTDEFIPPQIKLIYDLTKGGGN